MLQPASGLCFPANHLFICRFTKRFSCVVCRQQSQPSGVAAHGSFAVTVRIHGLKFQRQLIPCVEAVESDSGFGRAKAVTISATGRAKVFLPDQMMSIDLQTRTFTPAASRTKAKASRTARPGIFPASRLPKSTVGIDPTNKLASILKSTIPANR